MYKKSGDVSWIKPKETREGLRSQNKIKFKVPRARNTGYMKSPLYRGAELWDRLGDWYQLSKDKPTFKHRISSIANLDTVSPNPRINLTQS